MKFFTKCVLCTVVLFNVLIAGKLFALPGVIPYLEDVSGEYVFYRDYSFKRDTYIGFLYYNETTYAARYYSPATETLPAKNLEFLFTVDASKNALEMTGERILMEKCIGQIEQSDTDLINYVHDLIYEFASRRKKAGEISFDTLKIPNGMISVQTLGINKTQDFPLFGGEVTFTFNYLIPIFNLSKITDDKSNIIFEVVTTGRLESSKDESFSNYKQIAIQNKTEIKTKNLLKEKKKAIRYQVSSDTTAEKQFTQSVTLDSLWTKGEGNSCSLDSQAFLVLDEIFSEDNLDADYLSASLLRNSLQSTKDFYVDWQQLNIQYSNKGFAVKQNLLRQNDNAIAKDFRVIYLMSDNLYGFMDLIIFSPYYEDNPKYFDNIVKSYGFEKVKSTN